MKFISLVLMHVFIVAIGCAKPATPAPAEKQERSREVTFESGDLKLEGTFQLPVGVAGKAPAVLLLPGSGPTDRNGNSGLGIKTDLLKQIAEELAQNGIASLRFDKRAIAHYAPNWPKDVKEMSRYFNWDHFVGDAAAALDFLAKQAEVDPTRVGVLGHSEGALLSLQIGADRAGKPNAPKAIFLLGSTGRPMGPILHEQIARSLKRSGLSEEAQKPYLEYTDNACKALLEGKPLPPNPPKGLEGLFNPAAYDLMTAYMRIDPTELAKKIEGSVLVMNGKNDMQVSAERDAPKLIEMFKGRKGGVLDSLIVPDTSHNFKSTKGGNDDAFTGPMVPEALAKIISFAKANL